MAKNSNLAIAQKTNDVAQTSEEGFNEAEANATVAPAVLTDAPAPKTIEVTTAQRQILESSGNKSNKIRGLLATGMKRTEVAKLLGIRYQHVRNVELTPIKKAATA